MNSDAPAGKMLTMANDEVAFQIQGGLDDELRAVVMVRIGAEAAVLPASEAIVMAMEIFRAATEAQTDVAVMEFLGADVPTEERLAKLVQLSEIRVQHLLADMDGRQQPAPLVATPTAAQVAQVAREASPGSLWPRTHEDA